LNVCKERFWEHKLSASDRPTELYEYYVSGRGGFPFDMLRYDGAYPAGSGDAELLGRQAREIRSVKLFSYRPPTLERWSSFGWTVGRELMQEIPIAAGASATEEKRE
jgi:hypothetical protein